MICALTVSSVASALETSSGQLSAIVGGEEAATLTSLTLTGTMDARDFAYVAEKMTSLQSLDISGVTVEEYSDDKSVIANFTYYPEAEIPKYAFAGSALQSIVLPATVTSIGEGAFAGCRNLTAVDIPASVTSIGDCAFASDDALQSLSGCGSLTFIGKYAFRGDNSLASLPEMASLVEIGDYAFVDCAAMTEFSFPASIQTVGEGAFLATGLQKVDAADCASLTAVGAWAFADSPALAEYSLPSTLTGINDGAFFHASELKLLRLSDGVTSIGAWAFAGCNQAESAFLPASLESIGERAMRDCTALLRIDAEPVSPALLGDAVWENVNTASVTLQVPDGSKTAYQSAEQWKDFYIASTELIPASSGVKVLADDNTLTVRSERPILEVCLYDISGALTASARDCGNEVAFNLDGQASPASIVWCRDNAGKVSVVKILR